MAHEADPERLADDILAGNRTALGRAITLIESRRPDDRERAMALLAQIAPHCGNAYRIGITGIPGVGKSTFIEAFGSLLTARGHKVAVLAVDPSSGVSGGSILGDKTRMDRLARDPDAFIRPSPSGGMLGGVARATAETIALCEAAGFDRILVETVGAGQSEYAVSRMVDIFLVLMLPGAGDELQGIKKGVLEMADIIAVNKADRDIDAARRTARDLRAALRIVSPGDGAPAADILSISAMTGAGLEELLAAIDAHILAAVEDGRFETRRRHQRVAALWSMIDASLLEMFRSDPKIASRIADTENAVTEGRIPASIAAMELLQAFGQIRS